MLYFYILIYRQFGLRGTMFLLAAYDLLGLLFGALHRPLQTLKPSTVKDRNNKSNEAKKADKCPKQKPEDIYIKNDPKSKLEFEAHSNRDSPADATPKSIITISNSVCKNDYQLDNQHENKDDSIKFQKQRTKSSFLDFSLLKDPVFFIYGFSTLLMNFGMIGYKMHSPSRAMHYGATSRFASMIPQVTGAAHFISQVGILYLLDY